MTQVRLFKARPQQANSSTAMSGTQPLTAKTFHKSSNISLGPGDYSDVFRLPPSKEVDGAWHSLYTNSILLLTESEIRQMSKNTAEHVHLSENEDFGYGERRWLAKFDHIHLIHCLNMVRKFVHAEHYFPHRQPKHMGLIHVDHCIRSLLEMTFDIICLPSFTGPIMQITQADRRFAHTWE